MNDFIDNLYGVIFTPSQTLNKIARSKLVGQGLIVLILSTLIPLIASSGAFADLNSIPGGLPPGFPTELMPLFNTLKPFMLIIAAVMVVVFKPLVTFLFTALMHMISEFMGGGGSGKGLFAGFCFASFPSILMAPVNIINNFIDSDISGVFSLVFMIWVVILQITAVRENNGFSTGRAVLTYFLPWIIVLGILILMIVVMISVFSTMIPFVIPFLNQLRF